MLDRSLAARRSTFNHPSPVYDVRLEEKTYLRLTHPSAPGIAAKPLVPIGGALAIHPRHLQDEWGTVAECISLVSQDLSKFANGRTRTHHHDDESPEKGRFRLPVCHDLLVCYDGRILPSSN